MPFTNKPIFECQFRTTVFVFLFKITNCLLCKRKCTWIITRQSNIGRRNSILIWLIITETRNSNRGFSLFLQQPNRGERTREKGTEREVGVWGAEPESEGRRLWERSPWRSREWPSRREQRPMQNWKSLGFGASKPAFRGERLLRPCLRRLISPQLPRSSLLLPLPLQITIQTRLCSDCKFIGRNSKWIPIFRNLKLRKSMNPNINMTPDATIKRDHSLVFFFFVAKMHFCFLYFGLFSIWS